MTQTKVNELESRQIVLANIMASSDAHASKCIKLGLSFAETYPEDYTAYEAAREEYNDNEVTLAELRETLAKEQAEQERVEHTIVEEA